MLRPAPSARWQLLCVTHSCFLDYDAEVSGLLPGVYNSEKLGSHKSVKWVDEFSFCRQAGSIRQFCWTQGLLDWTHWSLYEVFDLLWNGHVMKLPLEHQP